MRCGGRDQTRGRGFTSSRPAPSSSTSFSMNQISLQVQNYIVSVRFMIHVLSNYVGWIPILLLSGGAQGVNCRLATVTFAARRQSASGLFGGFISEREREGRREAASNLSVTEWGASEKERAEMWMETDHIKRHNWAATERRG